MRLILRLIARLTPAFMRLIAIKYFNRLTALKNTLCRRLITIAIKILVHVVKHSPISWSLTIECINIYNIGLGRSVLVSVDPQSCNFRIGSSDYPIL